MKRIILIRHGETSHNTQRIFQADNESLSRIGRQQVIDLSNKLAPLDSSIILHSPLTRAFESAEILSSRLGIASSEQKSLTEFRNPPQIRGKAYDDPTADRLYKTWLQDLEKTEGLNSPDIENYIDLYRRAQSALEKLLDRPEKNILAVSHSELIRAIVGYVLIGDLHSPLKIRETLQSLKIGNAQTAEIIYDDAKPGWRLVL